VCPRALNGSSPSPLPPSLALPLQGETVELARPWRRASMEALVLEATGFDFLSLQGQPLEAALAAGQEALERVAAGGGGDVKGLVGAQRKVAQCASLGHVLNEVGCCRGLEFRV